GAVQHRGERGFQGGGRLDSFTCRHCFISCSPHNHEFGFLTLEQVRRALDESVALGVKEYYFTGGEPFLNSEMTANLELTLDYGPASVLTNASVLKDDGLRRLRAAAERSPDSLEWRVSLDGFSSETNDPIRGEGTFARTMAGVRKLIEFEFLPIITVAQMDDDADQGRLFAGFVAALREIGYTRPRLKILPALRLGAEVERG